ncbi:MAG TPA: NTPase [Candidatus Acidoferrales bacterium]|nr:NTPase [Candidatus Acidoferrales bacterium]
MDPQRLFLTGEPGSGKTTVVRKTTELLVQRGVGVGGMLTGEIREGGIRVGFSLEDLVTHEKGTLASVGSQEGPRVGKYRVSLYDIERIGVSAIERAVRDSEVVVADELGPMELFSTPFIQAVEKGLASQKHFLGTIHKRASHPLTSSIRSNSKFIILEITPENRDRMPTEIAQRIISNT